MATFELSNKEFQPSRSDRTDRTERNGGSGSGCTEGNLDPRRLREEPIIACKIYDTCRSQDCITSCEIVPRAAERICLAGEEFEEGDIITAPRNTASVNIDKLKVKKIIIVDKEPSPFKSGYWDVELKYIFEYRLTFRECDCKVCGSIKAKSVYNKKVTLFGSVSTDLIIATDLFNSFTDECTTFDADPFIMVEAKAVALAAELRCKKTSEENVLSNTLIDITIGLFSIVKLFRIVSLNVESRGFTIPKECDKISPLNPCEFFDHLNFPMDVFAPPQKPEFSAGINGDIKRSSDSDNSKDCGCE